jgi:hypothetical protein
MSGTQDWLVYTININGLTWDVDTNLIRPNEDLENQIVSTMQTVKMADGSEGYVTPETKSNKNNLQFFWADTTSTFRSKIEGYINSGIKLKIVTHDNQTLIGKFTEYKRVWFCGIDNSFDITATFKEMAS